MIVSLEAYNITIEQCLKRSGYITHFGSYVKEIEKDVRFHAKPIDKKHFDLHIDIYTENSHFAPSMPIAINKEIRNLKRKISYSKKPIKKEPMKWNISRKKLKKITIKRFI